MAINLFNTGKYSVGGFILGAFTLSLFSIPQKAMLGADPFILKGFLVPVLFGGCVGGLLGAAHCRIKQNHTKKEEAYKKLAERDLQYKNYFDMHQSVMLLIDPVSAEIIDANPAACAYYGYSKEKITGLKITDINTLPKESVTQEMKRAHTQKHNYFIFKHRLASGDIRDVEVYSGPIQMDDRDMLYSIIHDITERKAAEQEREQLIAQLKDALAEIKTLSGMLPICANCKKIRNDEGYWQQIEEYISSHSEAVFSHSICPECVLEFYNDE